jgi:hypothetical protein
MSEINSVCDRLVYHMRPDGLGIIIIELSVLLDTGRAIQAVVPTANHLLYDLKRIFKITDDRLIISHDPDSVNDPASCDRMKDYSPYFTADSVNLFGQDYQVGQRNKPCVGLAMHHAGGTIGNNNGDPLGELRDVKDFPYNKFATYDTYSRIIKLVTDMGYDIITLNSHNVSLEHKAQLLNNLCDVVIGYEGGVMQLAHTLKVPAIVLPWAAWIDGHTSWKDGSPWDPDRIEAHTYHLDRRTYFPNSQEEICSWGPEQLKSIIDALYREQGNNIMFTDRVRTDLENLRFYLDETPEFLGELPDMTKSFIRAHILN